jgi:hypothetical protein
VFSLFSEVVGSNFRKVLRIALNGSLSFSLCLQFNYDCYVERNLLKVFTLLFSRSSYDLASQVFLAINPFKYEAQTALFKDPVRTAQ